MVMDKLSGTLTGPNLISCISELSPADYDDFTFCTQIATHSADLVSSRFTDSEKWLHEYVVTLNFFWLVCLSGRHLHSHAIRHLDEHRGFSGSERTAHARLPTRERHDRYPRRVETGQSGDRLTG